MGGSTPLIEDISVRLGVGLRPPVPDPARYAGAVAEHRRRWRGRYRLRGRHVRERGRLRAPVPLAVPQVERADDRLVLQVLRRRPAVELDAAQVGVAAALPPSAAAPALDRLARAGLVRGSVVGGRERFGLP